MSKHNTRRNFSKNAKSDLRLYIATLSSILAWTFNERLVPVRFQNWNIIEFCFDSYFFLTGTNLSLKVQARIEHKVRIKKPYITLSIFWEIWSGRLLLKKFEAIVAVNVNIKFKHEHFPFTSNADVNTFIYKCKI